MGFHQVLKASGKLFLLLLICSIPSALLAATPAIHFEPNLGQTDARVRYVGRSPQGVFFFTDEAIVFSRGEGRSVEFKLQSGNPSAEWRTSDPTGEETSYMVGRDPSHWADHVPHYSRLVQRVYIQGSMPPGTVLSEALNMTL